ncbi:MAG: hypothetical protein GY798_09510 [Hyphomicrobiales bacterium]|nr:hypothetical protein [Hyphomicrobiales bacterium]
MIIIIANGMIGMMTMVAPYRRSTDASHVAIADAALGADMSVTSSSRQ